MKSSVAHARGFTLIEIVIVIALAGILMGLGLMLSMDVYRGTLFRSSRDVLVNTLTVARSRAMANMYQSAHGVCYDAPNFVVFRGTSYDASSPTNETLEANPSVTLSSTGDFFTCGTGTGIVFSQLAGTTSNTGVITVHGEGHSDETVSVNSLGTIVW